MQNMNVVIVCTHSFLARMKASEFTTNSFRVGDILLSSDLV